MFALLAARSGRSLDEVTAQVNEATNSELWLSAKEAVSFGIADKVIEPKVTQKETDQEENISPVEQNKVDSPEIDELAALGDL